MPAKGSKRARKNKGSSHMVAPAPPVEVLAKPAPYKPVDYSKFDNITDSDEESDHGMFGQPQMDLTDFALSKGDDEDPVCTCDHCRAKAQQARRAKQNSASSSKPASQPTSSQSGFNFGKAVENARTTNADNKAKSVHHPEDSTYLSPGASNSNMSLVKAPKEGAAMINGHTKSPKKSGQMKFLNSNAPQNGISDPVLRPTYEICSGFLQTYLPARGFSDRVMCNVLERLAIHHVQNTGEDPLSGLMRIFLELHIDLDPEDLVAYARQSGVAHKLQQQQAQKAEEEAQKHGKQPKRAEEEAQKHGKQAGEKVAKLLAKHGLKQSGPTVGVTSLAGNNQHYVQTGPRDYDTGGDADDSADSSDPESTDDEFDEAELPPLIDFPAPRFDSPSPWDHGVSSFTSPSALPAAKVPAAKSAAGRASHSQPAAAPKRSAASTPAKPTPAKATPAKATPAKATPSKMTPPMTAPAKAPGQSAASASKPSLARSSAKSASAAGSAPQPQHVTTVSDDESLPDLIACDSSQVESDVEYNSNLDDDMPDLVSDDDCLDEAFDDKLAKADFHQHARELDAKIAARNGPCADSSATPKGSRVPSGSKAEGGQVPSAVPTEPMCRPVSRGFLAQQTNRLAAQDAQASRDSSAAAGTPSASSSSSKKDRQKEQQSSGFSFNRAVSGSSKPAVAAVSTGKTPPARKPESSAPAGQQRSSPFPQFETPEDYDNDMGVPDLDPSSPPPGANRFGVDPEAVPEVVFDTGKERRTKTAMQGPSLHSSGAMDHSNQREVLQRQLAEEQQALRQQRERQLAADAVMKQLLEEDERDKAEAAEKAKKEKQKNKKAKQKAKKKAQQDKAAEKSRTKRAQAATSAAAAQPLTVRQNSMAESSESEGEEEQESVSLQDSRFASLVDDKPTPAVVIGWERAPSLGQGSQLAAPSLTHETAAGSSAADSDLEEEGTDSTMMQFGGAFAILQNMGRAGPSSEKSHSSQDTQASSQLPSVPVLKPGESPLQWSQVKHAAQKPLPESRTGGSRLQDQQGIRPGTQPGMQSGPQMPAPPGVPPPQAGVAAGQSGLLPAGFGGTLDSESETSLVLEACRDVLQEMEEASRGGDRGRLQGAIKGGVTWLSKNGSNPDVAPNSARVRSTLRNAKAILKDMLSKPAAAQTRPPVSSAAPAASSFSQTHVSMPAGIPPPVPPRGGQPPPPPPRVPPSFSGVPPSNPSGRAPAPQAARPYLQPYQPPPGGIRPGGAQDLYRQPFGQRDAQQQQYEPFRGGLEPYRMARGGTGLGAGKGPAGQPPSAGPGRSSASGYQPSSVIQDMYSVYRQGAVQRPPPPPPPPLPPAMPLHAPVPPQPAHSSHAGSDYGSLDRSSVSESDALSPVKRSQVQYVKKSKYVQPTPFGMPEQPSFYEHDDIDCVVCMDDTKCTIFVPCGHCLCCENCAETIVQQFGKCPVCSTLVDGYCQSNQ